jgi:hypothetical protein
MKFPLRTAFAVVALASAAPSFAQYTFSDPNSATTTIYFGGTEPGTSATLLLDLTGNSGGLFTFAYTLTNTSDTTLNPYVDITSFGFEDVGVTALDGDALNGFFTNLILGGQGPGPFGSIDVCLNNSNGQGNGCSGPNGVSTVGSGTFSLQYDSTLTSLILGQFGVRYQSTGLDGKGSGTGTEVPPVPEPATWAMMLVGLGAVGYALRRRRKSFMPQVA